MMEDTRGSLKFSAFGVLFIEKVFRHLFFNTCTVTGNVPRHSTRICYADAVFWKMVLVSFCSSKTELLPLLFDIEAEDFLDQKLPSD
jgi:hypothetical protein